MKGTFLPFMIKYQTNNPGSHVSSDVQAREVMDKTRKLVKNGAPGVAITYSANYDQTVKINKIYKSGGWDTGTSGSNQAMVILSMEIQEKGDYSDLQGKLRIAPITTMTYSDYGGDTHEGVVKNDLANIKALLDNGWTVLGWQNEDSISSGYAVGGGEAKKTGAFPVKLSNMVQAYLKQLAIDYPTGES